MLIQVLKIAALMLPVFAFLFFNSRLKKPLLLLCTVLYLALIITASLFVIVRDIYKDHHQPHEWDFLGFWLNGKVALSGDDFYDAKNYQKIPLPYEPGDEFRKEIIDVGFWYPPFTMFLFLPLGLFNNISLAYLLWQASNLLLCAACIYWLWRLFLKDYGLLSLFLVAALMLRLMPTWSTFHFAQTNFLNLLFFLFFWLNRSRKWGGIWLALCVVVKPYMAVFYLYPLIARKWGVFAIAILALLVITLLSFFVFGPDIFFSYLENLVPKTPGWVYTEWTNQSLLATILRSTHYNVAAESPILHPLYLGVSLILTMATGIFIIKNRNGNGDWIILSILFLTLIIYPANQIFYSVFLIVPISLLLQYSRRTAKEQAALFFIIVTTYVLSGRFSFVFYANLFMWLVCVVFVAKSNHFPVEKAQISLQEVSQ